MKKIGKKPTDDQILEGGGSGSGSGSFAKKAGKAAEIAGITALGGYSVGLPVTFAYKADKLNKEREEAAKAKREAANEIKRESRDMAKGGMTASKRADGCATKGKTKGRFV